ncbi:Abi-domain-containing protein [Lepidopterella palustris CBS 459.81]|uniref:intramembrane prenyl-peptidase Rce1 n=1 Tax=Lepidopterella palustris CBS 459.81 TaxID=1314670 RepID=A0A8E2EK13_9PEZI|nr:Abi-domain-containing protein [Lepidopterella palustris CBS 459.81]
MAPIGLLHRLKSYYTKEPAQKAPTISPRSVVVLSILLTLIYVVPFYLSAQTRPSPQLSRDAPSSIRARIRAVTISCFLSVAVTVYVIMELGGASFLETLKLLGWWPISILDTARTLLLVSILFAGPLFEAGIVEGRWKDWVRGTHVREVLSSWIGYRNFVAGPVSEELIWRSLIIPLHIMARFSPSKIIFVTPLYFGIAHVHHFYEFRLTHPHTPIVPAVMRTLFQFTYTSLFGFFAAFVFLRTGNVLSIILAHSFCNWQGLPRFWGGVGVEASVPIGPSNSGRKEDGENSNKDAKSGKSNLGIGWTVAYYLLLVSGAVGFYLQLFPLTKSINALPVFQESKTP